MHGGYGLAVDCWAVGCFLYEMLTGSPPFDYEDPEEDEDGNTPECDDTFGRILKYAAGEYPWSYDDAEFSAEAKDLIGQLCESNPAKRLSAEHAKSHAFFDGFDFMELERGNLQVPYLPPVKDATDVSLFKSFEEEEEGDDEGQDVDSADTPVPPAAAFGSGFVKLPSYAAEEEEVRASAASQETVSPESSYAPAPSFVKGATADGKSSQTLSTKHDLTSAASIDSSQGKGGCCIIA